MLLALQHANRPFCQHCPLASVASLLASCPPFMFMHFANTHHMRGQLSCHNMRERVFRFRKVGSSKENPGTFVRPCRMTLRHCDTRDERRRALFPLEAQLLEAGKASGINHRALKLNSSTRPCTFAPISPGEHSRERKRYPWIYIVEGPIAKRKLLQPNRRISSRLFLFPASSDSTNGFVLALELLLGRLVLAPAESDLEKVCDAIETSSVC